MVVVARGRRVKILVPQRGERGDWSNWRRATRSCRIAPDSTRTPPRISTRSRRCARHRLPSIPARIECFDISTIQGSETVASMVVCEDGRMKKSEYRKFRVRSVTADDFGAMREVVQRRYRKILEGRRTVSRSDSHRRRQGAAHGRV
jgi:excinuclease ABC subunit C